jgi:hypothetical protein
MNKKGTISCLNVSSRRCEILPLITTAAAISDRNFLCPLQSQLPTRLFIAEIEIPKRELSYNKTEEKNPSTL